MYSTVLKACFTTRIIDNLGIQLSQNFKLTDILLFRLRANQDSQKFVYTLTGKFHLKRTLTFAAESSFAFGQKLRRE